jgi:hypothetical protein
MRQAGWLAFSLMHLRRVERIVEDRGYKKCWCRYAARVAEKNVSAAWTGLESWGRPTAWKTSGVVQSGDGNLQQG